MPSYLITMIYFGLALVAGFTIPRMEFEYFPFYQHGAAVGSALAALSAIASGMMSFTAIIFAIAYVTVQFSAVTYSPRLALLYADSPRVFHALGIFIATFVYTLALEGWVDRNGNGSVPLMSSILVLVLMIASVSAFTMLIRGLSDLQVNNTLHVIGTRGRAVIANVYPQIDRSDSEQENPIDLVNNAKSGPVTQVLRYFGEPRTIARLDTLELVSMAEKSGAVVEIMCAVGDTLSDDTLLMVVRGPKALPEQRLLASVLLARQRTFEQDPKYSIRLLVDIAIKALSPAINDPTTAVQAIDQIEDLLHRLGRRKLEARYAKDTNGVVRVVLPMPTWEDYLSLSFDEIRQYGSGSVQVTRRLRSALSGVADSSKSKTKIAAVEAYMKRLDAGIRRAPLDDEDRLVASQEDRQGLGLSRKRAA